MSRFPRILAPALLVLLPLVVAPAPARAETDHDEVRAAVLKLLAKGDSYAAVEHVQSLGEPPVVAQAYDELVRGLHWKEKNARAAVTLGRAGILYCLTKAREVARRDPGNAEPWRLQAKILAYNVGSFGWPGWGNGITGLDEATVAAGRDAAALNLRLAREMTKPAKVLSAAHWLVGAHRLAAGEIEGAVESFEFARKRATEAGDEEGALMNAGYVAVARVLAGAPKAEETLAARVKALRARKTKDADFYATQLETALAALREWLDGEE